METHSIGEAVLGAEISELLDKIENEFLFSHIRNLLRNSDRCGEGDDSQSKRRIRRHRNCRGRGRRFHSTGREGLRVPNFQSILQRREGRPGYILWKTRDSQPVRKYYILHLQLRTGEAYHNSFTSWRIIRSYSIRFCITLGTRSFTFPTEHITFSLTIFSFTLHIYYTIKFLQNQLRYN